MKVTAQWIAEQCGVSRGTVDRVVNGRPNVAPEVRERVQKIISEYGYKTPSQRQAARAGHGAFRIGVILPSWDAFFIRRMREGIRVAVHNRGLNDVNVLVEELKNRSHRAYFEAIGRMEERGIDGLIVTAPDTVAMSEEIDRLVAIGIPVVTCDSDVRQSRRLYHIGQNMVKSGRIAAGLLAPYVEGQDVLVVTGNREFTAHGLRVRGFLDRLHEIFDDNVNVNVIESVEQYELTYDGVLQQVRQNPHLRGIYMANESVRGCMDALERAKPNRRIHVVCHDLTPHARQYLEDGWISSSIRIFRRRRRARSKCWRIHCVPESRRGRASNTFTPALSQGNCCEKGAYMKANWKRTLLSLVLCAGFVWPAGAVSTGQPAAPQTGTSTAQSKPAAYTVKKMGLLGVKRTVESDNNTVKMLNKTAASLDSSSYMSGSASGATGESEIEIYAALIENMKKAMDGLDKTSDLYKTYAAQLKVLEDYQTSLNQNAVSGMQQAMAMLSQLDDAAYTLRKQAKNVSGQLALGAQTMLITIKNLGCTKENLQVTLTQLDRNLAVLKTQRKRGMIGQLQLDTVQNQRDKLAQSIDTLETTRENLGSSVALMCGLDANTIVMPADFETLYEGNLDKMSYQKDLEQAQKNSFLIWQKQDAVRSAYNSYDKNICGTAEAVKSAEDALAAAKESVVAAFDSTYKTVKDCRTTLAAKRTAQSQAELDLKTATVKYRKGIISKLAYQQAQDAVTIAKLNVESAYLSLYTAYNQYEWAKEGVLITTAAA